jgi:hypothetical protein
MSSTNAIAIAVALVLAGPWFLGVAGWARARDEGAGSSNVRPPWDWRVTIVSALLYTLAFNLTFFIQELFLVLPKALTPGLRPTLFHNNHTWQGDNALAALFQGTGALAILLSGTASALTLARSTSRSMAARLFQFWMAYSGLFMALPQVVIGAISSQSDVGMAMNYLGLGTSLKTALALAALAAIPLVALRMRYPVLELAEKAQHVESAKGRSRFLFGVVTVPALLALPMIVAFRVPREWIEVAAVPAVVSLIGVSWIQAGAWWRLDALRTGRAGPVRSIAWPLAAVVGLLLIFQLLLRPGVRFY